MKYAVTHALATEDMYGYSAMAIPLTEDNLIEIKRLQQLIIDVKAVSTEISHIELLFPKIQAYVLNDEFEADENDVVERIDFSEEEWKKFTDMTGNSYKVDSAILTVGDGGFNLTYSSKYTSDSIWSEFGFDEILNLFEENLQESK